MLSSCQLDVVIMHILFQVSTAIRNHLNKANLQLIEELTFNTDDQSVELLVNALKASTSTFLALCN